MAQLFRGTDLLLTSKCNLVTLAENTINQPIHCRPLSSLKSFQESNVFYNLNYGMQQWIEENIELMRQESEKRSIPLQQFVMMMVANSQEEHLMTGLNNAYIREMDSGTSNVVYSINSVNPYLSSDDSSEDESTVSIGDFAVLRMTKPSVREKEHIQDHNGKTVLKEMPNSTEYSELIGLRYQALFSKNLSENGLECPNIGKVYDFGKYSSTDLINLKRQLQDKPDKLEELKKQDIILENMPQYRNKDYTEGIYALIERVNGGSLDKRIRNDIYGDKVIYHKLIIRNLLNTVNCLHQNGVAHRDIKPENIMLVHTEEEDIDETIKHTTIKLVDFGFCKRIGEIVNRIQGTAPFISQDNVDDFYLINGEYKEQVIDGRTHKVHYSDDIWSVGVILIELTLNAFSEEAQALLDYTLINNRNYGVRPSKELAEDILQDNPELYDFLKCIFRKYMDNTDNSAVSTAEQLLSHPWLAEVQTKKEKRQKKGGKRTKRNKGKKLKQRKTKSKCSKKNKK